MVPRLPEFQKQTNNLVYVMKMQNWILDNVINKANCKSDWGPNRSIDPFTVGCQSHSMH